MVEKKVNEILNRLNKTKEEQDPNFQQLREERDRKERLVQRKLQQEQVILDISKGSPAELSQISPNNTQHLLDFFGLGRLIWWSNISNISSKDPGGVRD